MTARDHGRRPAGAPGRSFEALSLPLPIDSGGPVRRLEPEQATPCAAAFDGQGWRFGVDWDGIRVVLTAAPGGVRIHDERLHDLTARLPEISASATVALRGRSAVLDGVVALLDPQGCPDLGGLFERLAEDPGSAALGLVLLTTDLLHLDDASLLGWPLDRRLGALAGSVTPTPHLQLPDSVDAQGRALAEAAAQRGLAAILARDGSAPYRPGIASPQRLRVPLLERADTVVVGAALGRGRGADVEALLLGEYEGGRLVAAGRVAVHAPDPVRRWLRGRVAALRTAEAPLEVPASEEAAGITWLQPSLVATIRHHGRGADGRPRLPSPVALREDRPVRWCVRRNPVQPPATEPPGPADFRPTVVTSLPLGE